MQSKPQFINNENIDSFLKENSQSYLAPVNYIDMEGNTYKNEGDLNKIDAYHAVAKITHFESGTKYFIKGTNGGKTLFNPRIHDLYEKDKQIRANDTFNFKFIEVTKPSFDCYVRSLKEKSDNLYRMAHVYKK